MKTMVNFLALMAVPSSLCRQNRADLQQPGDWKGRATFPGLVASRHRDIDTRVEIET